MSSKYAIYFLMGIVIISILIMPLNNSSLSLNIVGSTSVQPVCEQLVEKYKKTNNNVDINVQGGGTSLGIKCANSSVADIGMSSKDFSCGNLEEYEIGREGIVLIVNKDNPINDLSGSQIQKIFSGEINDWGEISSHSGKINVIVREEGSGTLDAFKKIIMKDNSIKNDAIIQNSAGGVKQSVIQDKNAIGFVSLSHLDNTVKNLSVDGVYASKNSIIDGSYELQRPFILLTNKSPDNQTRDFIDWVMSNESQSVLDSEKIIRVD